MLADNFELARRYWPLFEPVMEPGESLLTASAAIYVELSERLGKAFGDGTIGLTDRRFIHLGLQIGGLFLQRSDIKSVERNWIALPASRKLTIRALDGSALKTHTFYCGTGFSKDIVRLLS